MTEWTWNGSYQKLFDKANAIIKADTYMKFCTETRPLYLETGASAPGSGAGPLQIIVRMNYPQDIAPNTSILGPTVFTSISLLTVEKDTVI